MDELIVIEDYPRRTAAARAADISRVGFLNVVTRELALRKLSLSSRSHR